MLATLLTRRPKRAMTVLLSALALAVVAIASIEDVSAKTPSEVLGGNLRYLTYLTTDKPIYRAGDTVYLRAVLLSAHDHTPNSANYSGNLEIKDPAGAVIYNSGANSELSVLGMSWTVPEGTAGGEYTAKVHYEAHGWAPAERKFDIRAFRNSRLTSQMEFLKKAYGPGDSVFASLNTKRAEGGIPSGAKVTAIVRVDGEVVYEGETKLDDKGNASVSFKLPNEIRVGEGSLAFVIQDGGTVESTSKTLPILLRKLDVAAYPEGGDLIAGLESRVYFQAKTPWGDPADFEGKIVDLDDNQAVVGRVASQHEGRGATTITPKAGHRYALMISKPSGILEPVALPEIKTSGAVISKTERAYGPDAPIEFEMASTSAQKIRVVASNYEKEIAAATLAVEAGVVRKVMLTPPGSAEGVIRLTLYSEEGAPLAERLVFRQPRHQMKIEISANREGFTPRDEVELTISARDHKGDAIQGAVLGVTVSDESVSEMIETRKQTARLPGLIYLESNVEKFEDARFYLSEDPQAANALDLLLGTQGWRRFAFDNVEKFKAEFGDAAKRVLAFREEPKIIVFGGRGGIGGGAGGEAWGDDEVNDEDGGREGGAAPRKNLAKGERLKDDKAGDPGQDKEGAAQGEAENEKHGEPQPVNAPQAPAPELAKAKNLAEEKRVAEQAEEAKKRPAEDPAEPQDRMARLREDRREDANGRRRYNAVRVYAHQIDKNASPSERSDFTETVYWSAAQATDANGQIKVKFQLSDSITTFKVSADGFTQGGLLGTGDLLLTSRKPFFVEPKLPLEVTAGDLVLAPVVYANNSDTAFEASYSATLGKGLSLDWQWDGSERVRTISTSVGAGERVRDLLPIRIGQGNGAISLGLNSKAGNYSDTQTRSLRVVPRGFPIYFDKGGLLEAGSQVSFEVNIPEGVVPSSIKTEAKVYPTPLANLQSAVAALIRQPYGCFEQTSSVVYPMVMAQQYLTTHEGSDVALIAQAKNYIDAGYKKLIGFECKEGGYEWFGSGPGHEALTAYGVVEFADIAKVQDVDKDMLARTQKWLADRKDGNGGFLRNARALDSFGGAPTDITNAYIVWSLTREGNAGLLTKEIDALKEALKTSTDSYFRGLVCGVLYNIGEKEAADVIAKELANAQAADGSVAGAATTITRSVGASLLIETTSIAILNWLANDAAFGENTEKAIRWLSESCQNGRFGSTQGTVLALKAIMAYDDARAHPKAPGKVVVMVDGKAVETQAFDVTTKGTIELGQLATYLTPGNHQVTLQMVDGSKMPYSLQVEYFAETPASSAQCPLWIETKLSNDTIKEGEITEVSVELSNVTKEGLATTMALVGIPGGLEVKHEKLKELVASGKIAFYEVLGREVALYFRDFAPSATVKLSLDCVAAVPGEYTGPASRAYLYYGDEFKNWTRGLYVKIAQR